MFGQKKETFEFLVVGLGNPGQTYANTRHNAGFIAADYILQKHPAPEKAKFNSLFYELNLEGHRGFLQKPLTFMNNSGEAVGALCSFYRIPPQKVIVMHDDITLPPGSFKLRRGGSDGGHNGITSIEQHLKTPDFLRVKIGIGGKLHKEQPLYEFVLGTIPEADRKAISEVLEDLYRAIILLAQGNENMAMSRYNAKKKAFAPQNGISRFSKLLSQREGR